MCKCIDTVLNDNNQAIFFGTTEEIEDWLVPRLVDDEEVQKSSVMLGHNLKMISVEAYLANARRPETPSEIMDDIRKRAGL